MGRAAKLLTGAGGALVPRVPKAGAGAILAGALLERWAIFRAGFASAGDPKYVVEPQRERAGR
jgi:hypothetical protein